MSCPSILSSHICDVFQPISTCVDLHAVRHMEDELAAIASNAIPDSLPQPPSLIVSERMKVSGSLARKALHTQR